MIVLKNLKIKGFRAYTDEQEFTFESPIVLLFGENHKGKSSTLNAIEWCLFGSRNCTGGDTGIRERINWEIPNRTLVNQDVWVELELTDEKYQNYKILRRWIRRNRDEVQVTLPNGQVLEGQEAEKELSYLIKSSFRDFLTTVYQHQEVIRSILVQEPRQRNDAIDRLLGLSDYRNILKGINEANLENALKNMNDFRNELDSKLKTAKNIREYDLKDKKERAFQRGIHQNEINQKSLIEIAKNIKEELEGVANEWGLSLDDSLKIPEHWSESSQFQELVNKEITKFRSEMPDIKEQERLNQYRLSLSGLKIEYEQLEKKLKQLKNEKEKFIKEIGDEEAINKIKDNIQKQIEEKNKELSEADAKASVISKAMEYLKLEGIDKDICPVCGKRTPDLLAHLEKEWREKYEKKVGEIKKQIDDLKTQLNDVERLEQNYKKLREDIENVEKEIKETSNKIGEILGETITTQDDPIVVLNKKLAEIQKELQILEKAVSTKQENLNEIASKVEKVQLIGDILNLEEKRAELEQIEQLPEYKQMEELIDKMSILCNDVKDIEQAIKETMREEAQNKIEKAEEVIDSYFRRITNNPLISKVRFLANEDRRTGGNLYEFRDQDGKDLLSVLSQGDLNALALAIFLGMATSESMNQSFGFIMLDDPSQSLGSQHKANLVEVLNKVLEKRMVILSTMDEELQSLINSQITKRKTKYLFSDWTPEKGPEVKKE